MIFTGSDNQLPLDYLTTSNAHPSLVKDIACNSSSKLTFVNADPDSRFFGISYYVSTSNKISVLPNSTIRARNLQFRPLQNSEDLYKHYTVGHSANGGKQSAAMKRLMYCILRCIWNSDEIFSFHR